MELIYGPPLYLFSSPVAFYKETSLAARRDDRNHGATDSDTGRLSFFYRTAVCVEVGVKIPRGTSGGGCLCYPAVHLSYHGLFESITRPLHTSS